MRSSNNKRSRNKNQNRNRNSGANIINRVFDSSGPEGKVRGTPQQIIDKYQSLARDAQLSGDRIAHENFMQHSEHYSRLLSEAQREMAERKEQQQQQQQQRQQQNQNQNPNAKQGGQQPVEALDGNSSGNDQPDIPDMGTDALFPADAADTSLVETPESKQPPKTRNRRPRPPKPEEAAAETGETAAPDADAAPAEPKLANPAELARAVEEAPGEEAAG